MGFFGKKKWDYISDEMDAIEREEESRHGLVSYTEYNFQLDQTVTFKTHYKHGIMHGNSKTYYQHGQLFEDGEFRDGVPHGPVTTYHEDGQIKTKGQYKDGRMHGKWLIRNMDYIDSDGRLHCKEFTDTIDDGELISSTDTDREAVERRRAYFRAKL